MYKCSDATIKWFTSYLYERNQCISFKGKLSDKLSIKTGVQQGAIFGPLLFIIFIKDLPLVAIHSEIDMYANDSTVTSTVKTTEEINGHLNIDMKEITKWCVENCMSANPTKTKSMLIMTWQKRLSLLENQRNNDTLENVKSDKLLRDTIDHNLSWEKHITTIVSTINRKLALLRRIKRYMSISTRKLFFNTFILPHIDYCAIIWGSSPHTQNLLLDQKKAARVILDIKDIYHHSKDMFLA